MTTFREAETVGAKKKTQSVARANTLRLFIRFLYETPTNYWHGVWRVNQPHRILSKISSRPSTIPQKVDIGTVFFQPCIADPSVPPPRSPGREADEQVREIYARFCLAVSVAQ